MGRDQEITPEQEATLVMSRFLWNAFEYALPIAPGHMAQLLVKELQKAGLQITRGQHNENIQDKNL
jgi:hypothetical protein